MSDQKCNIQIYSNNQVTLESPAFSICLDTSSGLRATSWQNTITGRKIDFKCSNELEIDLDAADSRVWITGWRFKCIQEHQSEPDQEKGYLEEFYRMNMDDTAWEEMIATSPDHAAGIPDFGNWYTWSRTHAFLPLADSNKEITLTLGGYGLFDYRYMRVFVNGQYVGTRTAENRWNKPGVFEFAPGTFDHSILRFGQDNIIAVQCTGYRNRTDQLDELDPDCARCFGLKGQRPGHCEQYFTIGKPLNTPAFKVETIRIQSEGDEAEVVFALSSESGITANVTYRLNTIEPVLHKFVSITNTNKSDVRLMDIRLGSYETSAAVSDGEQGFPVYIDDQFFVGIAHPSGWATGQDGKINLRQYPGKTLKPQGVFDCMESVYGTAELDKARALFLSHIRGRSRRVTRGHDKPYAILEAFGARSEGNWGLGFFDETEEFLLDNISKISEGQSNSNCHFDLYSIDFWVDCNGDLQQADPVRFPNGLTNVLREIKKLGTNPGLWIDSSMPDWTIGGNPVVRPTYTFDPAHASDRPTLCRATDPIKTMYSSAFRHHIRENGIRMIKFDNLQSICYNTNHEHFPGIYSTEAIQSSVIETLRDLDEECHDVFLMLYWGYRSPWWLLYADTIFEPGLAIEAAHPADKPTLYVRDSVTLGLDQAQWFCQDVPNIGKDSLGVWLSDWKWNSSIGKERWQEAFVMDICRGSLLAQPWSDNNWLSPSERVQMAEFITLLKAQPNCFSNPRFILGNPWKNEPYGYCCSDGKRAFISINNCTWSDIDVQLELNQNWGLPENRQWNIYREYPNKAQLTAVSEYFSDSPSIVLRPFEVVLLEVVPVGDTPSLVTEFTTQPIPTMFIEPSCNLPVIVSSEPNDERLTILREIEQENSTASNVRKTISVAGQLPESEHGGYLVVSVELSCNGKSIMIYEGKDFAAHASINGQDITANPVVRDESYGVCWQAWRMHIDKSHSKKKFNVLVATFSPEDHESTLKAYFIPAH